MLISNNIFYNNYCKSPAFTSIDFQETWYTDSKGIERLTHNDTNRREDLNYANLAKIINERFQDCDNVNIMPMNVSDGTEAYFIFKYLAEEVGLDTFEKKFKKINATDVCENVIEKYPKKGVVKLKEDEFDELNINGDPMFEKTDGDLYALKPKYKKYFNFETQDFQERLKHLEDNGNSVVIIRNCLRYSFGNFGAAHIVRTVNKKLKGNSLFITGDFDRGLSDFELVLRDNFVEVDRNVWAKRKEEEPAYYRYQDALVARIGKSNFEQTFKDGTNH